MNNYRVCFGGEDIDYKSNFKDCRRYFPVLSAIYDYMQLMHVDLCWHFFEPYVEFTWVCERQTGYEEEILQGVVDIVSKMIKDATVRVHRPKDGNVTDWYCKSDQEQQFGYVTYALSARMAMMFWRYRDSIDDGHGQERQYMRRCHVLANQLAMNYDDESEALFKRSRFARHAWDAGDQEEAVRRYESEIMEPYER